MYLNFILTFLSGLMINLVGFSQGSIPKDYHNETVKEGQLSTTKRFLRFIESGDVEQSFGLIDSSYLIENKQVKKRLQKVSSEIQKFKDKTTVSEGLIVYEEGHNVYRCIYHDDNEKYQLIDLHFHEGQPNSKIVKVKFKDKTTLTKEKNKRKKQKDTPPPPPYK